MNRSEVKNQRTEIHIALEGLPEEAQERWRARPGSSEGEREGAVASGDPVRVGPPIEEKKEYPRPTGEPANPNGDSRSLVIEAGRTWTGDDPAEGLGCGARAEEPRAGDVGPRGTVGSASPPYRIPSSIAPAIAPDLLARWEGATEGERAAAAARLALVREAEAYAAANRNGGRARAALLGRYLKDRRAMGTVVTDLGTTVSGGHGAGGAGETCDATGMAKSEDRIPTLGTLYRWMGFAREAGFHPAALLDARLARRADAGEIHAAVPEPAKSLFLGLFLNTRQLSVKECLRGAVALLKTRDPEAAAALPGYLAFLRLAEVLPEELRVRYREGARAWQARFAPYIERDPTTLAVNEWWVADHMQFDVLCRLPDGRLGRPWLTQWMDIRSRRRLGWCVWTVPSQDTILLALARAIRRAGVPGHVYMDNGRDFTSLAPEGGHRRRRMRLDERRVETVLAHLAVVAHFSRPGNPQSRLIERHFGTDHQRFDKWFPTYTGRDPQHKPEDLPAALKDPAQVPTLEQLEAAYGLYVERVANQEPSEARGLDGFSPLAAWQAGIQAPGYVHRTATDEELKFLLMKRTKALAVRRGAVEFAGRRWTCAALQDPGAPAEVTARYDQEVAGRLWLFTAADEFVGAAERQELLAYGATQRDIREGDRRRRILEGKMKAGREAATAFGAQPDHVLAVMTARLQGAQAPPPDPKPTVIRPIRTPFRKAAPALKAVEAAGTARVLPGPPPDLRDAVLDLIPDRADRPEDMLSDDDRRQLYDGEELPARPARARRSW